MILLRPHANTSTHLYNFSSQQLIHYPANAPNISLDFLPITSRTCRKETFLGSFRPSFELVQLIQ